MGKTKICHVLSGLGAGGVESVIYNYCSQMDKNKYEWHILYQHEPSQKNIDEFEKLGFKLVQIPSKSKHPIKNYKQTYDYFRHEKIDVVHCHMTLMNFIPLIAARRLKIKSRICHSHNSDVRKKGIIVKCIEKILKRLCIMNATSLLSCGEEAGRYMYGEKKFTIINNALDLKKFRYNINSRKNIRNKYHIDNDAFIIGHIGRFTNQKNHTFIINIFKEIHKKNKKAILMLIGDGELREEIMALVKAYKLTKYVIFTGIVSNTNDYYSAFDMFILPSIWEGLPVVGIEAQISGLNCLLANNIDHNVIVIKEKVSLLGLNEIAWVNEAQKIINMKKNRKIDENQFNQKNFNILKEVEKLENIYNI